MQKDSKIKDIRIHQMDLFIESKRPPKKIRDKLDLGYRINDQEIIIFTIRPNWKDQTKKIESPIARTKYIKSRKIWKIYWMRADAKWHLYDPAEEVNSLNEFLELVEEDKHHCFWG